MSGLYQEFQESVRKFPTAEAVRFYEGERQHAWSYQELQQKIDACATGLTDLGLQAGDRLGLISSNGHYWPVVDFAVSREGLVLVPIHSTLSKSQIRRILEQSGIKALLLGPGSERLLAASEEVFPPAISTILCLDAVFPETPPQDGRRYFSLSSVLQAGETVIREHGLKSPATVQGSDVSTIMYTSGTTGEMKGVMLTHHNLIHNAVEGERMVGGQSEYVLLSVLPLSHAFERVAGLLGPLFIGNTVAYGRGLHHLAEDIRKVRPHQINVVPRLLEKMYEGIHQTIKKKSRLLEKIFLSTVARSQKYRELRRKKSLQASCYFLSHQVAEFLFYKKVRQQLGGRLDRFITGGAALNPRIGHFFSSVGFKVLEGYGLTECSPIVTVSPSSRSKIGSVGLPLPGVEVRLGPEGEIWVRGPNVMRGYENNPQATREAIDAEGWFHTGDQGGLDEEGYLYIRGRLNELIVTSYGKNILPSLVERALEASPLIHQVAVFGHNKPYLVGLVILNPEEAKKLAGSLGLESLSMAELCRNPLFSVEVEKEIARYSQPLAHYERLKRFTLLPEEFSEEFNFLTPTLKLKRKKISEHFALEIDSMYGESEPRARLSSQW